MSILSSNIFTQRMNTEANAGTTASEISSGISDANKQALLEMIDSLSPGDTILGKVLSQSGKNLSILTQDGATINAKNDGKIAFDKGSSILFEVQAKNGKTISLRPLYQNTSVQKTAEVALRQAGLPINGRSLEMTGRNMEYGNPIDRDSLINSYKDVALHPEASVKCIIDLQKMELPITDNNINQYNAYMNMENSVTGAFSDIADTLFQGISENIAIQGEEGAMIFNSEAFNTLSDIAESLDNTGFKGTMNIGAGELLTLFEDARESGIRLNNLDNLVLNQTDEINVFDAFKAVTRDLNEPVFIMPEIQTLNAEEGEKAFLTEENVPLTDQAALMEAFIARESVKELFKKTLNSRWSLDSEELGDKAQIKDLYTRLYSETGHILEALNNSADKNAALKDSLQNLRQNLEFMNDLNQFVPYLQIPFHSEGAMRNSELYVYSNKKNLASSDGTVSAFIHLDMDHLGPTDIYVKLSGEHVSTNFTVKDEDTLIFLEHHMDFLNKRLSDKGYSMECFVKTGKETKSPMEQMLEDTERHLVLQETSFDARV